MLKELAKSLGLPETATEVDVTKALAAQTEAITKLTATNAANEVLAKMSDKHKAHAATLTGDAKDNFMAMDNDAKDAACAKSAPDIEKALRDGEAFKTPTGVVISKAKVGVELFDVLKGQNDALVVVNADLAKAKEDAAVASFTKRATDLGFEADFGATMRKAYSGDATAQGEVEKRMKALQKQAEEGGLFKNFGRNGGDPDSAEAEFMVKVEEVKKAEPKLKAAQAYAKAYTDPSNQDIVKRMKEEVASA